jgi:hypothetical protein
VSDCGNDVATKEFGGVQRRRVRSHQIGGAVNVSDSTNLGLSTVFIFSYLRVEYIINRFTLNCVNYDQNNVSSKGEI